LFGLEPDAVGEVEAVEQFGGAPPGGGAAGAGEVAGDLDVFGHGQGGEQVEVLEDEADVSGA
jgi:hypothetical protein